MIDTERKKKSKTSNEMKRHNKAVLRLISWIEMKSNRSDKTESMQNILKFKFVFDHSMSSKKKQQ